MYERIWEVQWPSHPISFMPNADQCRSKFWHWSQCRSVPINALRGISDRCHDFDRHWSALGIDRGSHGFSWAVWGNMWLSWKCHWYDDLITRYDSLCISSQAHHHVTNFHNFFLFLLNMMRGHSQSKALEDIIVWQRYCPDERFGHCICCWLFLHVSH